MQAGFVGLGDMGGPMAMRLARSGIAAGFWARRPEALDALGLSTLAVPSLRELGARSDIVGICVFGDQDVLDVVLGESGVLSGMRGGGVIVVHSTVGAGTIGCLESEAARKDVEILDAPVSGARMRAVEGTLCIMVGGKVSAFQKALPVLQTYGRTIRHVGALGSGQKMKTLNNTLGSANLRMASMAIQMAERLGLDPGSAIAILRESSGASFNLNILADRLMADPPFARHAANMVQKDLGIFREICARHAIEPTLLESVARESVDVLNELGSAAPDPGQSHL
jgi:3-hydroxyisobutyrate dehydrogenase